MKKRLALLLALVMVAALALPAVAEAAVRPRAIVIDSTTFPSKAFRQYVLENIDTNGNGKLTYREYSAVKELQLSGQNIASLKGIEFFPNLVWLWASDNRLAELDVSRNTKLQLLHCDGNRLKRLDVSMLKALKWLDCSTNKLTTLDVTHNRKLIELGCQENLLKRLDVTHNARLMYLYCGWNRLSKLNVTKNRRLEWLRCVKNRLTALNIGNNAKLTLLNCQGNKIRKLNIGKCPALLETFAAAPREDYSDTILWDLDGENQLEIPSMTLLLNGSEVLYQP